MFLTLVIYGRVSRPSLYVVAQSCQYEGAERKGSEVFGRKRAGVGEEQGLWRFVHVNAGDIEMKRCSLHGCAIQFLLMA